MDFDDATVATRKSTVNELEEFLNADGDSLQAWIQGDVVVVEDSGHAGGERSVAWIDDGTGVAIVDASEALATARKYNEPLDLVVGQYAMALGGVERDTSGRVHLAARKLIDLSAQPDRLSMWICEVVEARMRERGSAQGE